MFTTIHQPHKEIYLPNFVKHFLVLFFMSDFDGDMSIEKYFLNKRKPTL